MTGGPSLSETMFSTPEMSAVFSGASHVGRMLEFEAALARSQARAGLIPGEAAEIIAAQCRVELFDLEALFRDAATAGTPALPLVRMLTGLVAENARGFVHWGATSQDAIDTATMLQIREGLDLLIGRLTGIAGLCAGLAERHRATPMAGRTFLQHAVPITFGLKGARWLALTMRLIRRLRRLREESLAVQLGGASGTLASLGDAGIRIMESLARDLDLAVPDLPWHTERDRIAEIAAALGILAGAMGKIATDLALLSQTEVGEVSTGGGDGRGRSSTMPHKRNPVEAAAAIACGRVALSLVPAMLSAAVQEHERGLGGWQAEWEAFPRLFCATAAAAQWVHRGLEALEIHPNRMRANLDLTNGLIMAEALTMALAPRLGRDEAYRLVQRACDRAARDGAGLRDVASADPDVRAVLSPDAIGRAFDISQYLGSADAFIARALSDFRDDRSRRGSG